MKKILLLLSLCLFGLAYAQEEASISADRPGMATGVDVIPMGKVQWETGFECGHDGSNHSITFPTTMFRVGITPWAELRVEYDGTLSEERDLLTGDKSWGYAVDPLVLGTKVKLFNGTDNAKLRWIPQTSLMVNLAIPSTKNLAQTMHVAPSAYLLFHNDITDWFAIDYNLGAEWNGYDATPATFLALCLGFGISDNLGAFVESYNYFTKVSTSQTDAECCLDFGFNYVVHPRVQLDLYAGFCAQDPKNTSFLGLGVAWLIN